LGGARVSLEVDLAEGNIRLKRWMRDAVKIRRPDGTPFVVDPGEPHMYASKLWPVASRFRIIERRKFASMVDMGPNAPDSIGKVFEAECCCASAPNFGEAIMKYVKHVSDPKRDALFQDRNLRGESTLIPPVDPPEWRTERAAAIAAAQQAGEATAEWVRKAAQGHMKYMGFDDDVKFALAWQGLTARGLISK
jgi:hypothetical protein